MKLSILIIAITGFLCTGCDNFVVMIRKVTKCECGNPVTSGVHIKHLGKTYYWCDACAKKKFPIQIDDHTQLIYTPEKATPVAIWPYDDMGTPV